MLYTPSLNIITLLALLKKHSHVQHCILAAKLLAIVDLDCEHQDHWQNLDWSRDEIFLRHQ